MNNKMADGTSLDKLLSKITADVVKTAIEKVSYMVVETDDEDFLLEQLNNESFKDSVIETSVEQFSDLPEILKSEEVSNVYVREKCSTLVEDTIIEVYDKLRRIFDSNGENMSNDIESSNKKLKLLDCIKDSDRLQVYFQDLSASIVESAFDDIVKDCKHLENGPYLASDKESDIEISIDAQQGSELNIEKKFDDISKPNNTSEMNSEHENNFQNENQSVTQDSKPKVDSVVQNEDSNVDPGLTKGDRTLGSTANSTMYQTTEDDSYNVQSTIQDSFFSAKDEITQAEQTTVDSTMFTTADDLKENSSIFLSFEKDSSQVSTVMQGTPGSINRSSSDIDATLTSGPRQSTPLIDDKSNNHEITLTSEHHGDNNAGPLQSTPFKDESKGDETILPAGEESHILPDNLKHHVTEYERTLQELSGDESSFGEPSTPRTLSRQSSAFGNVTLEFETDWEASMKGVEEKSKPEEKHRVILHELSFEDHHRLKAPELLCPVFLAVQDDEFGDGEKKTKHKMSQSIDDLCEMISEDSDDDKGYPLRRRAMSFDCKKPPFKGPRKKAPTREELLAAFQELQHEIMEEKEMEDAEEEVNEEDEEQKGTPGEEIMGNHEPGLDDPLRWHTVVFNGQHKVIDLKVLEPFLKVLTHGGYHHEGDKKTVIVVLTACNLPNKKIKRYSFVMEQLFFFIISTMDLLVTSEEYIFVYFHGGTSKNQSPSFSWLKKYYQYIDHRLRKSVTKVYVVHPNLWLKSVFRLCRPFVSSNFARKLKFVNTLKELSSHIKTDFIFIPDEVVRVDPGYRKIHTK